MLQVYVDSEAAARMECCVCVKLIQCMHEWAFVQMSSDMFGYLVLHTLTHIPPHTCTHTHIPSHIPSHFTQGAHAEWYFGVILNEEKLCQVL